MVQLEDRDEHRGGLLSLPSAAQVVDARVDNHWHLIHTQGTTPDRPLKEIFTGADFGNLGARD